MILPLMCKNKLKFRSPQVVPLKSPISSFPFRHKMHRVIPQLVLLLLSAPVISTEKVAGGAALEDVVPMQKVKKPKLREQ